MKLALSRTFLARGQAFYLSPRYALTKCSRHSADRTKAGKTLPLPEAFSGSGGEVRLVTRSRHFETEFGGAFYVEQRFCHVPGTSSDLQLVWIGFCFEPPALQLVAWLNGKSFQTEQPIYTNEGEAEISRGLDQDFFDGHSSKPGSG